MESPGRGRARRPGPAGFGPREPRPGRGDSISRGRGVSESRRPELPARYLLSPGRAPSRLPARPGRRGDGPLPTYRPPPPGAKAPRAPGWGQSRVHALLRTPFPHQALPTLRWPFPRLPPFRAQLMGVRSPSVKVFFGSDLPFR